MEYCCEHMKDAIEGGSLPGDYPVILYTSKWRSYGLVINGNPRNQHILSFCPFCGAKLPEDLADEHFDTILEELGPEYLSDDDGNPPKKELPEEFKTDEWWKKRGL